MNTVNDNILEKKPKVVVFDVDETLGHFGQFGLFFDTLSEFYNNPNILYTNFNELIDYFMIFFLIFRHVYSKQTIP